MESTCSTTPRAFTEGAPSHGNEKESGPRGRRALISLLSNRPSEHSLSGSADEATHWLASVADDLDDTSSSLIH